MVILKSLTLPTTWEQSMWADSLPSHPLLSPWDGHQQSEARFGVELVLGPRPGCPLPTHQPFLPLQKAALKHQDNAPRSLGCAGQSPQLGLLSQSSPLLPAVLGPRPCGKVPLPRPVKCRPAQLVAPAGRALAASLEQPHILSQADAQRDVRPQPRPWRLPTIDRKVGRY